MVRTAVAPDDGGFSKLVEEDFDVIQEALDYYLIKFIDTVQLIEASKAATELFKKKGMQADISEEEATRAAKKVIDDPSVKDRLRKMKEKICLLKAKLVMMKEKGRESDLGRAIEDLTGG